MRWDANGYYARLGVTPEATRTDLRRAYQAARGHEDPRLTYALTQLLDPETRRRYDATPLGEQFLDDELIADIVDELSRIALETSLPSSVDASRLPERRRWPFAYYVWGAPRVSTTDLQHWQRGLVAALVATGWRGTFAVGVTDAAIADPWHVRTVGRRLVAFLQGGVRPSDHTDACAAALSQVSMTLT